MGVPLGGSARLVNHRQGTSAVRIGVGAGPIGVSVWGGARAGGGVSPGGSGRGWGLRLLVVVRKAMGLSFESHVRPREAQYCLQHELFR